MNGEAADVDVLGGGMAGISAADLEPDYRTMPRATFTDPVRAAAGLTEAQARRSPHAAADDR